MYHSYTFLLNKKIPFMLLYFDFLIEFKDQKYRKYK
jgi:hypothetical protein